MYVGPRKLNTASGKLNWRRVTLRVVCFFESLLGEDRCGLGAYLRFQHLHTEHQRRNLAVGVHFIGCAVDGRLDLRSPDVDRALQ